MAKALVLTGHGINCEHETAYALELTGITPDLCHLSDLIQQPKRLLDYPLLMLPGGFSYGDDVASGKLIAVTMQLKLHDTLQAYIDKGGLIVGICNGFQVLVKLGLLPHSTMGDQQVTLTHNQHRQFINRWVWVTPNQHPWFFHGVDDAFMLPIRHGEGRLVIDTKHQAQVDANWNSLCALTYEEDVNGAYRQCAAMCNPEQTIIGMMPHPEAFVHTTHHPNWQADAAPKGEPAGRRFFMNLAQRISTN